MQILPVKFKNTLDRGQHQHIPVRHNFFYYQLRGRIDKREIDLPDTVCFPVIYIKPVFIDTDKQVIGLLIIPQRTNLIIRQSVGSLGDVPDYFPVLVQDVYTTALGCDIQITLFIFGHRTDNSSMQTILNFFVAIKTFEIIQIYISIPDITIIGSNP